MSVAYALYIATSNALTHSTASSYADRETMIAACSPCLLLVCAVALCSAAEQRTDAETQPTAKKIAPQGRGRGVDALYYVREYLNSPAGISQRNNGDAEETLRQRRQTDNDSSSNAATEATPFTLPGGLTIPTLPENLTLPTLPEDFTIPTLPETLPSITLPTLPGGFTLPPNVTLPVTLPDGVTLPANFTLPTLPSTITLPTFPENFTFPTLPGGITIPDGSLENVTLPPDFTLPPFENFTLPPDFTLPSFVNFTLPGGVTFPPDIANILTDLLDGNLENFTLPPFTLPPDFTLPGGVTFPTDIANILTDLLDGNLENFTLPPFTLPPDFTLPGGVTFPTDIANILTDLLDGNLENFTLPPFTLPPDFTLPGGVTFPTDIASILTGLLNGSLTLPPDFTLPPFTLPPDFTLPGGVTIPTAIVNILTDILNGNLNLPTLDILIASALTSGVSGECAEGWLNLFNTTDSSVVSDGIQAVDAFGKLGAGYLQGNTYALGSYDECFSLDNTQYCLTDLVIKFDGKNPELHYAICLPQTCSSDDIRQAINSTNEQLTLLNVTLQVGSISCETERRAPYNAGAIIMLLIWSLIGATMLGATAVHLLLKTIEKDKNNKEGAEAESSSIDSQNDKRSTVAKFVFVFSLYKAIPAMLSTKHQQEKSPAITSLHGLKVISLLWIILGHTHIWALFFSSNSSHVMNNVVTRFSYQAILSSPFGFDSFFLLSGVLVAYVALQKMAKKTKRNYAILVTYYIRRILHFTPVYAIILFSYWLLTVHLADGPVWRRTVGVGSSLYENCERNWWTNLFYINNLHPWANLDECMPWSWYLSSEIQFFVIAPVMILPLYFIYPVGLVVVGAFLVANVVILGGITGSYELSASIFLDLDTSSRDPDTIIPDGHNTIDDIHIKPWTHLGPFVIGILLGFIFYKKYKLACRKYIDYIVYTCLWGLAFALCFSTVYGLYGAYDDDASLTEGEEIVYQMFSRLSWAMGLAIVIYSCHHGYGWIINDFLSMKIWIPLSRLSLITYLIHPVVLFVLFYTRRAPVYSTGITLAAYAVATAVLSYGVAVIIACFVDLPLSNLEAVALKLVGLGDRKDAGNEEHDMEFMVGASHENYYFTEVEEEMKRKEAGEMEREGAKELESVLSDT